MPGRQTLGWLSLWHSDRCAASWAEATYFNPNLYRVRLSLYRPADGAAVTTEQTVNIPRAPVYGKLLLTDLGCVRADVVVEVTTGPPVQASIGCR